MELFKHLTNRYGLPVLSGLMLIAGYPGHFGVPGIKWVALVPLIWHLNHLNKRDRAQAFKSTLITSLIFIGYVWSWYYNTLPLDWNGLTNPLAGFLMVTLVWVVVIGFMAPVFSLAGLAYHRTRTSSWRDPLIFAAAWTGFEMIRNFTFSIYAWGHGARIGEFYSFGALGYGLHNNRYLLLLASLGGVYLLSFLVAFVNAYLAQHLEPAKLLRWRLPFPRRHLAILLAIIVVLSLLGIATARLNGKPVRRTIKFGAMQANFPSEPKPDKEYFQRINQQYYEGVDYLIKNNNPDLVILPEDSRFLYQAQAVSNFQLRWYLSGFLPKGTTMILTNRTNTTGLPLNVTYAVTQDEGIIGSYQKNFVVPFGESIPWHLEQLFGLFAQRSPWWQNYKLYRTYQSGNRAHPLQTPLGKIASFSCSEIYATGIIGKMINQGGELIVTPASEAIFRGAPALLNQNEAASKVRAAETNRYLIEVVNSGHSLVIDNRGKTIQKLNTLKPGYLTGEVPMLTGKTPFVRFGNWPAWLSLGALGVIMLRRKR